MATNDLQPIITAINERNYPQAHALIDQLTRNQPASARLVHLRAVTFLEERNPDRALEEAELAIELDPNYPPTYEIMGTAAWMLGQKMKAQQTYEKGLELSSEAATTILPQYAMFLAIERWTGLATKVINQATEQYPDEPSIWVANAWLNIRSVKFKEAHEMIDRALALNPFHEHALHLKIFLLRKAGETDQADRIAEDLTIVLGHPVSAKDIERNIWQDIEAREDELMLGFAQPPQTHSKWVFRTLSLVASLILIILFYFFIKEPSWTIALIALGLITLVIYTFDRLHRH